MSLSLQNCIINIRNYNDNNSCGNVIQSNHCFNEYCCNENNSSSCSSTASFCSQSIIRFEISNKNLQCIANSLLEPTQPTTLSPIITGIVPTVGIPIVTTRIMSSILTQMTPTSTQMTPTSSTLSISNFVQEPPHATMDLSSGMRNNEKHLLLLFLLLFQLIN